ncbi:hypothetical protein LA080_004654 [Diaporthe eres]|nr:hypothetical protein LA080_004654 [Diaporthe eres]
MRPEDKGTPSDHIDAEIEPHTTVDAGKTAASLEKADNSTSSPDGAQSQSGPESTEFSLLSWTPPSGTPTQESWPKSHIEYVAWIHLEYVLSVCAVPVLTPKLQDCSTQKRGLHFVSQTTSWEDKSKEDYTPVALTCGDIFAFQFLIEVAKKLAHHPAPNPYIKTTQKRIRKVLHGHVRWLESLRTMDQPIAEGKRKRLLKSGCYSANYLVTGQIQHSDMRGFSWKPCDSVTDTPFHILKLIDYMDLCKAFGDNGQEAEVLVRRILRDVWVPWYHELDDLDKRASFAWPHATGKGFNTYTLADQFWIWKTLKALHDSGVSNQELSTNSSENEPAVWNSVVKEWILHFYDSDLPKVDIKERFYEKFGQVTKRFHPHDVQRGILQRFTTENAILRKRMLAVTRSPIETRFLFHARDTALFYGQDCGFFLPGSSFQELWNNTIEAQIHHNESQDAGWDKALRYALGIVAGCRHLTFNNRSSEGLVRNSIKVLISSTGHNGFFPGQLDMATKEPDLL